MTEKTAAELAAENHELREQLRQRTRRDAAEKAGLPGDAARWIDGDSPEEAAADARALADQLGSTPAPRRGTQTVAQAISSGVAEQRQLAQALSGNGRPNLEGEGRE